MKYLLLSLLCFNPLIVCSKIDTQQEISYIHLIDNEEDRGEPSLALIEEAIIEEALAEKRARGERASWPDTLEKFYVLTGIKQ